MVAGGAGTGCFVGLGGNITALSDPPCARPAMASIARAAGRAHREVKCVPSDVGNRPWVGDPGGPSLARDSLPRPGILTAPRSPVASLSCPPRRSRLGYRALTVRKEKIHEQAKALKSSFMDENLGHAPDLYWHAPEASTASGCPTQAASSPAHPWSLRDRNRTRLGVNLFVFLVFPR